jgi:hypothetical protein
MTLARSSQGGMAKQHRHALSRSSRSMGIYLLASRGTGKSRLLGRKIAMQDYLAGFPQVVFDPVGATIDNFLDKVTRFLQEIPASLHSRFWDRIVYVDMSGKGGVVTPFPLYYRLGTERSLLEISERYLQTIIKSNPALFQAQVLGWPPLHRIGVYTGMVLAALGYQITEAAELLARPEQWESRFHEALARYPEAQPAVAFFRTEYIPMRDADRSRLTTPFLDKIFTFSLDPTLRAMFGATEPGIKWDDVANKGQTVLLDFRREQDEEMRRFKLLWAFSYLYEWIKTRGRRDEQPFGLIIDEFAHMTQQVLSGDNPLAKELDEFINVYMRQHTIWLTVAHQELYQIDEQLRNTLLSLGTYILGSTTSMAAARELADTLFSRDPTWVKHYRRVWGRQYQHSPLEIIDHEPEFMPLAEQTELFAQRITRLGRFQFLLRPAIAEGHIGSAVLPLTIQDVDRDKETGAYQFPETNLMQRLRAALVKHAGIPVIRLLQEQEARLAHTPELGVHPALTGQGAPSKPRQRTADGQTRQRLRQRNTDGTHRQGKPRHTETDAMARETQGTAQNPAKPILPTKRRHALS